MFSARGPVRTRQGRERRALLATALAAALAGAVVVVVPPGASSAAPGDDVLIAAGDIGWCPGDRDEATADVIDGIPGTVLVLGDIAYPDGSDENFANCYDPSWGRHKARTRPVPGNHEYNTESGRPYYDYFGAAAGPRFQGWYSFEQAGWHVIGLNSSVSMAANSEQMAWLRADLAASSAPCTVAMLHHPRFSSGTYAPGVASVAEAWNTMHDAGVDVVLSGHEHFYERFAPMDRAGATSADGMRAFTVGTGGTNLRPPPAGTPRWPASEVLRADVHGVLSMALQPTGYSWEFRAVAGQTLDDRGTASCTPGPRTGPTTTSSSTTTIAPTTTTTTVPGAALATDTFTRTTAIGWGSADLGGAWSTTPATGYSVTGTHGSMTMAAGTTYTAALTGVQLTNADVSATLTVDKPPTGSGQYFSLLLRRVSANNEYAVRIRRTTNTTATIAISRRVGGAEVLLSPEVPINGWTTGTPLRVRGIVTGTGPTTLTARAWPAATPEPSTWAVTATDNSAALQRAGAPALIGYLSSATTNTPVTLLTDDLEVRPAGTPPPTTTTTTAPATTTSTSTTTTTAPPTTTSSSTTTIAPTTTTTTVPGAALATDTFTRTTAIGWGSADLGGAWSTTPATGYSVTGTHGSMTMAAGTTYTAALTGVQLTNADVSATLTVDKPPTGSGQYFSLLLRRVSANNEYAVRIRRTTNTTATIAISRRVGGAEVLLSPEVPINGWTTGTPLRVRGIVTGTGPTTLTARAWPAATPEPSTWAVTATDNSAALQRAGAPALIGYLSSATTNTPVTLLTDDLRVTP